MAVSSAFRHHLLFSGLRRGDAVSVSLREGQNFSDNLVYHLAVEAGLGRIGGWRLRSR